MRVIIVGCGRTGAGLAESLARADNDVTILDINTEAFGRLEPDFPGNAVRGDGTDEDVLRRAGAEGADAFFSLTEGDNRNILTAQLAAESLGIPMVVAKINDPVRAQAYRDLGLATICRTTMMVDAMIQFLGLPADPGVTGVSTATGHHPGGEHHAVPDTEPEPVTTAAGGNGTTPADDVAPDAGDRPGKGSSGPVRVVGAPRDPEGRSRRAWKLLRRSDEKGGED